MKTTFLCLDFGATRVKWTLNLYSDNSLIDSGNFSNPYLKSNVNVEISIGSLIDSTKKLISNLAIRWKIEKILISSQMHGFALMDSNNHYLTDYISWFDQRFLNSDKKMLEKFAEHHSNKFYEHTGMTVKSGLPYFNSISVLKSIKKDAVKLVCLPEIILHGLGVESPRVHTTLIAGSGFFNINKNCISKELLNVHNKLSKKNIYFNDHTDSFDSFETKIANQIVNISIGYGDHQCAVLGANNSKYTTSINMGTGSQVSKIISSSELGKASNNLIQFRPFFKSEFLKCITHIPSGRVLNNYLNILEGKDRQKIWNDINKLKISDVINSSLIFNLAIFPDAYKYEKEKIGIYGIRENNFTYLNYLSSLINSYLNQYFDIVDLVEKKSKIKSTQIILSGGLAKQIKISKKYFQKYQAKKVIESKANYIEDEAILGLKKIMKYEN